MPHRSCAQRYWRLRCGWTHNSTAPTDHARPQCLRRACVVQYMDGLITFMAAFAPAKEFNSWTAQRR